MQESDFDFGELPGFVGNNNATTSTTSVNVTQQALKLNQQLIMEVLLGDDAGSGVDVDEGSGDELLTTSEDDVSGTTTKTETEADAVETTTASSTQIIITSSSTLTRTTTTNATLPTVTTEEPVSAEPG